MSDSTMTASTDLNNLAVKKEIVLSNNFAAYTSLILGFLTFIVDWNKVVELKYLFVSISAILLIQILRLFLYGRFLEPSDFTEKDLNKIEKTAMVSISFRYMTVFIWNVAMIFAITFLNANELITTFLMAINLGLSAGLATSLTLNMNHAKIFLLSLPIMSGMAIFYRYGASPQLAFSATQFIFTLWMINIGSLFNSYFAQSHLKEKTLEKQNETMQSFIDAIPGFVSLIDYDLKYLVINKTLKEKFPHLNFIGSKIGTLNKSNNFVSELEDFMNSDQQRKSMEIQMNETFHHHWFLMTLQKINKPQGIVIHTIDIQNVKETTNELEKERARNHNNARLAELGEMVGGIAHEINNPLAVINVRAQNALAFIAEGTMTPEKVKTSFESILKTSDRISQIIKSMKKAARNAENDPMEPIKVSQILDDTMTLCNHRIRLANIKIENRLHDQDIKIECRTSQITQVLINLIGNSIDSIEKKPEPWIRIETKDLGSNIQIRITDSGLGISEKIRDKIMNPFFTTKEVGKGTGMGLSISMGIIKSHGGSFTLDTSNSNTSFVIELPYLQKNPVQQTG